MSTLGSFGKGLEEEKALQLSAPTLFQAAGKALRVYLLAEQVRVLQEDGRENREMQTRKKERN